MKFLQILVLILGFAIYADAQKIALSGVLYDANGAVIVGATVKAINKKGDGFETRSNDEGIYIINLSPEIYKISFEQPGFKKFIIDNLRIVNSTYGKINQDIVLDVYSSHEHEPCGYSGADCPAVLYCPSGEQEIIQTTEAKVSNKIPQRLLEKLPKKQNKTKRKNKNNK